MSLPATLWAWKQDIPTNAKAVLLALAFYADPLDDSSYPSQPTITRMTGVSRAGVWRVITDLEMSGLIFRAARLDKSGRRTSNVYQLHVPPEFHPDGRGSRLTVRPSPSTADTLTVSQRDGILDPDLREVTLEDFDPFSSAHSNGHSNTNGNGKIRGRKNTSKGIHPWPDDQELTPEWRAFAVSTGGFDPDIEFQKFHNWALSKAERSADWFRRWCNWCLKAKEIQSSSYRNGRTNRSNEVWEQQLRENMEYVRRRNEEAKRKGNSAAPKDAARPGSGAVASGGPPTET